MVFSEKTTRIIKDPTKKSVAFSGEPTREDVVFLAENGWIYSKETELKSGKKLYLWVRILAKNNVDITGIRDALQEIEDDMEVEERIDKLNEQIGRMGGGRRKSRKQKKSKKSKRSKKSRKSIKRRR
jgi:hypothetical protein